jgi:heme exporter protein B
MFNHCLVLIKRDLQIACSKLTLFFNNLFFLLISSAFFALAFARSPELLGQIGGQVILVIVIFSFLLSAGGMFEEDTRDGTIEQLLVAGVLPVVIFASKVISDWILRLLPLLIILPVICAMFHYDNWMILWVILLISPLLTLSNGLVSLLIYGGKSQQILSIVLAAPLNLAYMLIALSVIGGSGDVLPSIMILLGMVMMTVPPLVFFGGVMLQEKA